MEMSTNQVMIKEFGIFTIPGYVPQDPRQTTSRPLEEEALCYKKKQNTLAYYGTFVCFPSLYT